MKKSTRIFAAFAAALLLIAMAVPAFATPQPTGSITIMEPADGVTYSAYQIFSVTDDNGTLTYTAADPWKAAIIAALEAGELSGLQIAADGTVTKLPYFKAADFAAWAKENIPVGATAIPFAEASGKLTTGAVAPGYYLVVPGAGDLASLCTVLNDEIAIQDKNDMPFDKQVEIETGVWGNESGVNVGDTLNFRITGKVPTLPAEQESYFYLVSDYLTSGLDLTADSVVVKIGDTTLTLDRVYDPEAELTGNQIRYNYVDENDPATPDDAADDRLCGFDLSIDMLALQADHAGDDVVITYTATVNENAIGVISENNAGLDYGDENSQHHKDSMTKHYTSTIIIDKFETGSPESKLPGAKFVLKNAEGKFYHVDETTHVVTWKDTQAEATEVTTDAEGGAQFGGLADGTYYLVETAAPSGYTVLTDPIEVVVDGSDSTAIGLNESEIFLALSEFVRVSNTPGSVLPSTGGIGTYIFYIVGGVLVAAAVVFVLMLSRERKKS